MAASKEETMRKPDPMKEGLEAEVCTRRWAPMTDTSIHTVTDNGPGTGRSLIQILKKKANAF